MGTDSHSCFVEISIRCTFTSTHILWHDFDHSHWLSTKRPGPHKAGISHTRQWYTTGNTAKEQNKIWCCSSGTTTSVLWKERRVMLIYPVVVSSSVGRRHFYDVCLGCGRRRRGPQKYQNSLLETSTEENGVVMGLSYILSPNRPKQ